MNTTKITRGDDLMLFVGEGPEGATKKSLAFATSHTLTLTSDVTEIACKDSGLWKDAIPNKLGWEITAENLYAVDEYDKIFDLWTKRDPIIVYFGLTTADPLVGVNSPEAAHTPDESKPLYSGKAVITNLAINAASGENATFSITLQGVGAFAKVAPGK